MIYFNEKGLTKDGIESVNLAKNRFYLLCESVLFDTAVVRKVRQYIIEMPPKRFITLCELYNGKNKAVLVNLIVQNFVGILYNDIEDLGMSKKEYAKSMKYLPFEETNLKQMAKATQNIKFYEERIERVVSVFNSRLGKMENLIETEISCEHYKENIVKISFRNHLGEKINFYYNLDSIIHIQNDSDNGLQVWKYNRTKTLYDNLSENLEIDLVKYGLSLKFAQILVKILYDAYNLKNKFV